eukprot:6312587-Pyramimonas_sp.AAC.1
MSLLWPTCKSAVRVPCGLLPLGPKPPAIRTKIQDTECAAKFATMVRNIPRPAFQLHPDDHAEHLNDELVRAVIECFPVQKSPTGRLPRQS